MPPGDILAALRTRPFIPFRIVTTDGTVSEIRHPALVMVGLGSLVVGYPAPGEPSLYSRLDIVATRHIVRLETIEQPAAS